MYQRDTWQKKLAAIRPFLRLLKSQYHYEGAVQMKLRLLLPRLLFLSLLVACVTISTAPVALAATIDAPRVNVHKKSRHLRTTHTVHHKTAYRRTVHSSATVRRTSYSYHHRHYRHRVLRALHGQLLRPGPDGGRRHGWRRSCRAAGRHLCPGRYERHHRRD